MKKNIFSSVILSVFFLLSIYISGFFGGIKFVVSLVIYSLLFYGGHIIWMKLGKRPYKNIQDFCIYFTYRISILLLVLAGFFSFFIFYENYYEPALLPEFTITNGQKTIIFQGMAHIGSDSFYNKIKNNITNNKKNGFVLFFEGVKLGKEENMKKFDKLIGFEFNKKTYVNLSKLYGLRAQNNQEFLNLVNSKDYNTDISMDDIITNYEKKFGEVTNNKSYNKLADSPLKIDEVLSHVTDSLTPRELQLLIYVNRAVMNFIIKNENVRDILTETTGQQDLFGIILNDRNRIIVDSINNSKDNKIHILYGLMHFNGVWAELQRQDPNWKVVSIRYFKPID